MQPPRMLSVRYMLAGVLASILCSPAYAQTERTSGSASQLDEIVVTAQRRETNLQETPIAVTALSSVAMEERGIKNVGNLENFAPNLQINQGRADGGGSTAQITIRGVGQNDPQFPNDPGVGLYVDGVYSARSYGGLIGLVDIERIEVLRGPQGTLFGRNTIGGAVNIITKPPEKDFGGNVSLLYGSYNRVEAKASLNVPLIDGLLAARFSAGVTRADGLGEQIGTGVELGNENRQVFRAVFRATPSEDVTIDLAADYTHQRQHSTSSTTLAVVPSTSGLIEGVFNPILAPMFNASLGLPADAVMDSRYVSGSRYDNYGRAPVRDDLDSGGASLTMTWSPTDSLTLKSITAARGYKAHISMDQDGTPYRLLDTDDRQSQEQYSQELQAYGDVFDGRISYLVGLYYFKELARDNNAIGILPGTLQTLGFEISQLADLGLDATNYAAFGQFDIKILDDLSLTIGLRQNHENKRFSRKFSHLEGGDVFIPYQVLEKSWDSFTPRLGLNWTVTDDVLLYGSYAEGFKGGGWNPRPVSQATGINPFAPESIETYEVGAKTQWFDRRLTLNVAVFHSNYANIQLPVVRGLPDGTLVAETQNAGKSRIYGAEVELAARPTPNATIQVGYGYFSNKYVSIVPGATIEPSDKLPDAPLHTLNIGGDYRFDMGDGGELTVRGDASYRSEVFKDAVNTPLLRQPSFWLLSGRLIWSPATREGLQIQVYGTNLLDEEYLAAGLDASVLGSIFGYYGRPREFGIQAAYKF